MNDIELRERFDQWAALLLATPPPGIAVIRSRARRRTARIAGAAGSAVAMAAAVTGLVVSSVVAPSPAGRPAFWGTGRYPAPHGEPYVFVNESAAGPAEIRDVATGTVVGRLTPLDHGGIFTAVAVTSDDRLFVLGQQDREGRLTFAAARVGSSGSVHLGRILPGVSISSEQVYGMTVNPAGTRLVLNTLPPGGAGGGRLLLYNLTTGALLGSWPEAGLVGLDYWRSNAELVLDMQVQPAAANGDVRILQTNATFRRGTLLIDDTRPDHGLPGFSRGQLTSDGSVALAVWLSSRAEVVKEFSAATGRLLRTIPIGSARPQQQSPYFCGVLWASANGRDLLTQCGTRQQAVTGGTVTRIRLPWRFLAQQDGAIETFAW
jgi:hypothetical protein